MRYKLLAASAAIALMPAISRAQSSSTVDALKNAMQVQPYISVANTDANNPEYSVPHTAGSPYSGVVYLQVLRPDLPPGFADYCTGALINGGSSILTAAHCLSDTDPSSPTFGKDIATSVNAFIVTNTGSVIELNPTRSAVNPQYTGNVIDEHDVGVINLDAPVTQAQSYNLYQGDAVGRTYNVVGWGLDGTGDTGTTDASSVGHPRQGYNRFDFSGTDPIFGTGSDNFWDDQNVYVADFDNGLQQNDGSCFITSLFVDDNSSYCDLGLGSEEVDTAPGDSGGPEFVFVNGQYQIAGVTSFGITFGSTVDLGGGLIVQGSDVDDALNSSYGELAGYTRTDLNQQWIYSATPEPSSLALLGTGLFALVPMVRRRRK